MYDEITARNDLECVTGARALSQPYGPSPALVHDLGNLLQAATSAINIIEREAGSGAARLRRAIDGARLSIGHASELVHRALAGRSQSRDGEDRIDLEQCLREVATVIIASTGPGIAVEFTIDAGLPPVACDRLALHNALLNLVINARDAVSESGRIAIMARKMNGDRQVEISVADNGIGMASATIDKAFEPFFTTKCDGLGGIGLPMVERFVTATGGLIRIDSEPEKGTIVRMQLPAAGQPARPGEMRQ